MADDFARFSAVAGKIYDLRLEYKHRNKLNSMNDAEVMVILYCFIPVVSAFSDIITRNTYVNIRKHLFMWQIFYNCFVELENEIQLLLTTFIKKVLLGTYTGISF